MKTPRRALVFALLIRLLDGLAQAAYYSGTHADITDFMSGSEVSSRGVLIDAVNLSNDGGSPTDEVTINGVTFKSVFPGYFHEGGEAFADASFVYHGGDGYVAAGLWNEGGAYDLLADSQLYAIDNYEIDYGDGYGVVNLTPGVLYELQVFMLDSRDGIDKSFPIQINQATWNGNVDEYTAYDPAPATLGYMPGVTVGGAGVTQANGEIATILFAVDEGFNGLFVNTWDNGAFNGMQLRSLGVAGDYDGNGAVETADYNLWAASYGSTSNLAADGNFDGVVDAADYTLWRDFYSAAGDVATTIPEPTPLVLGVVSITWAAAARRRDHPFR